MIRARGTFSDACTILNRNEFERLYQQQARNLYAYLVYRTSDPELAEDVLAATFERVLASRRRFDRRRGSERTWLYAIALNALRDHYRKAGAERRALARVVPHENPEPGLEAVAARDELGRALASLTDAEREAVSLRYGADLTLAEMARVLKLDIKTVEGRLYRGLRKLRRLMGS